MGFIRYKKGIIFGIVILAYMALPGRVLAGTFELSASFSFSESNYGYGNLQWTRRWGGSFGYYFWQLSEIEFEFQDVLYRTFLQGVQDTTFHDQVYSIDWVQALLPKSIGFQPYVKVGIGQLNRDATGSYTGGLAPPAVYDAVTVVLGAGLKIYVTRSIAFKFEGSTYLADGIISSWQSNFGVNAGMSIYF